LAWHLFYLLFFLSCSLAWKYIYFFIAHTLFLAKMRNLEREVHNTSDGVFILVDGKTCFCVTLSVRVIILFVGVRES
jgi:hypothetical protein